MDFIGAAFGRQKYYGFIGFLGRRPSAAKKVLWAYAHSRYYGQMFSAKKYYGQPIVSIVDTMGRYNTGLLFYRTAKFHHLSVTHHEIDHESE